MLLSKPCLKIPLRELSRFQCMWPPPKPVYQQIAGTKSTTTFKMGQERSLDQIYTSTLTIDPVLVE